MWSLVCQQAFEALKQCLIESPILAFPDFGTEFLLETDASGVGLGAVLAQKQQDGTTCQQKLGASREELCSNRIGSIGSHVVC